MTKEVSLLLPHFVNYSYYITNWVSNSMEHSSSWEANSHSAVQKMSHRLWDPKVHYLFTRARKQSLSWARWI